MLHRRSLAARGRGLALLGAVLALAAALPALAQTGADGAEAAAGTQPAPDAAPETPAPSRPAPPEAIPTAEIPRRAQEAEQRFAVARKELAAEADAVPFAEAWEDLQRVTRDRLEAAHEGLDGSPSIETLEALDEGLAAVSAELEALLGRYESRVEALTSRVESLRRSAATWERSEATARAADAPASVTAQAAAAERAASRLARRFEARRGEVLDAQSRVAALRADVEALQARLAARRGAQLEDLLVRSAPPLWRAGRGPADGDAALASAMGDVLRRDAGAVADYARLHAPRIVVHVVGFLLLLAFARRVNRELAARTDRDQARDALLDAVRHPLAASAFLALAATPWLHDAAPASMDELAELLLLAPLVVVLRPLIARPLHAGVYALAGFRVADSVRALVAPAEVLARSLLVLELFAAAALLAWILRPGRVRLLPRGPGAGGLRAVGVLARLGLATALVAGVAEILGYVRLGEILGRTLFDAAYVAVLLLAGTRILEGLLVEALCHRPFSRLRSVSGRMPALARSIRRGLRFAAALAFGVAVLDRLALRAPLFDGVAAVLGAEVAVGSLAFSVANAVLLVVTLGVTWILSRALHAALEEDVFPRVSLPRGVPYALATLSRYAVLVLGFLAAMAVLGFGMDRLVIVAGALGIGIGFGLQSAVNNFVSGLILLFERPVQVGDVVEVGPLFGEVRRIGIRSSSVRTWDGADVIVPNADLVSQQVTNWTYSDRRRRLTIPVGVAYGSDVARVMSVLGEAAAANAEVLDDPAPQVLFQGFGDSSLDFEVRAWLERSEEWPLKRSALVVAIEAALRDAGITIPFPQRDLHLKSVAEGVGALGSRRRSDEERS